ncbi:alpha/beta hydrolase [Sphingobium sp. Ant17]|uniref:alpha/beta hydrolase n=1 Tax=Sphingobium sp. Ant17 TaxID=1461752 RepID=UPI000453A076|nr:alpha/beta hydrolase [Sphingobium sp. Ant17]EXS69948.1 hydrolase [Sphingobium sp. Ant17]
MTNAQISDAGRAAQSRSIVLVHGAFVDASGWQGVYTDLVRRGFEVLVTQHPTQTLSGDIAVVKQAIAAARNPVVLVGHSYGGAVITAAGNDAKVAALAYVAAFVPDMGESIGVLTSAPLEAGEVAPPVVPGADGTLIVDPAGFAQAFAADVDADTTRFLAAAQQPWGMEAVVAPVDDPAWKTKPSAYMVASLDRMIPPRAQRMMAERAGAAVTEIEVSHAVMLSKPAQVAEFIARAAAML